MSDWISVDEYLPQQDFEVLVCQDDDVFTAIFREGLTGNYFETSGSTYNRIEHWQPLPEPPKEQG